MSADVEKPKEVQFEDILLDAVGTREGILGKHIPQSAFPEVLSEVVEKVGHILPSIREAAINSFAELDEFLSGHVNAQPPENAGCPVLGMSKVAEDLLEVLGIRYKSIDRFIHGAWWRGIQINDISTEIFADGLLEGKKQVLEVFSFARELLREQGLCIVTEIEKANPDLPSCGLFSKITVQNFYEVIRSAGAELLAARNDDKCFGICVYHRKGSCADEDREFYERACKALVAHNDKIVAQFGEPFDPDNCASTYGAFISPTIKNAEADGGAATSRGLVYDAFIYHMLREYAQSEDRPRWILGWVRSYPNPNTAENAHEKRGYFDTGIELPFEEGSPLRLKLLLINLDQMAPHGQLSPNLVSPLSNTPYAEKVAPLFARMQKSAHQLRFINLDN